MAVIRSGASADELTIDPTSKAARITLYDSAGNELAKRKTSYQAGGRLAAGTGLSKAATGGTAYQLMTIYHVNTSTKTVRIQKAWFTFVSDATGTSTITVELVSLTSAATPATGNPAITPQVFQIGDAAADSTVLCLPTTPGTLSSGATGFGTTIIDTTGATATTSSALNGQPVFLYQYNPLAPTEQPTIRSGQSEGWAISVLASATHTYVMSCGIEFTEE